MHIFVKSLQQIKDPKFASTAFSFFLSFFFSCFPCQLISELHDLLRLQPRIQSNFNIWNTGSSHHSQFNINQMLLVNLYITSILSLSEIDMTITDSRQVWYLWKIISFSPHQYHSEHDFPCLQPELLPILQPVWLISWELVTFM